MGIESIRFEATVTLRLSSKLNKKKTAALERWFKDIAPDVLRKGAREEGEGASVESVEISGDAVKLKLATGRSVRPHDAAARLRRSITEDLGRELGAGVRGIEFPSYKIRLKGKGLKTTSLPFTKSIKETADGVTLDLELSEKDIYDQVPDRLIKLYVEKMEGAPSGREVFEEVWRSRTKSPKYSRDPNEELVERGWVKKFTQGIWYYMPPFASLVRAMESIIVNEIAKPNGFVEVFLPKLITLDVMRKKGQLYGIPNEMFYVCEPLSRDMSGFQDYADLVKITGETHPEKLREKLRPPEYGLPFAQCEPFYEIFSGQVVDLDQPPAKFYDKSGFSFRYESGGLTGLERLNAFTRIELAFLGNPEQVMQTRDSLMSSYQRALDGTLDLEVRTKEVTPVWMAHAGMTKDVSRDVPATLDIEVYIPHRGDRETSEWLEVANASVHFDKYVDWYNVKEKKGRETWTGCSGNGLERLAVSVLANHGFEYDGWPKGLKNHLEKLPEPYRMVTWPRSQ